MQIQEVNITAQGKLQLLECTESKLDVNPVRAAGCRGYLRFHPFPHVEGVMELRSIFVCEEYRQKGYGTKFIKWLEKYAKDEGYTAIYLRSSADGTKVFGKFLAAIDYKYENKGGPIGGGWWRQLKKKDEK